MPNRNEAHIEGHLGKDPEVRYSSSGLAIVNLSVATSHTERGESVTSWHRVVAFGELAEHIDIKARKGDAIGVIGRIQYRTWVDKDGNSRTSTEIVAHEAWPIERVRQQAQPDRANTPQPRQQPIASSVDDDDLPF